MRNWKQGTTLLVSAAMALAVSAPVMAQENKSKQDKRQQDKNTMRNLGIGLGAGAAHELIKGRGTNALILGGGAAYAAKKAEDQRKAQRKNEQARRTSYGYSYAAPIDVVLNDEPVPFSGARPTMIGDRVYVPLRGVLERMGAGVGWDADTRTVMATKGNRDVRLPVNSYTAKIDDRTVSLDAPARIVNGRTMVPLRFISEAFGAQVTWDSTDREVIIES